MRQIEPETLDLLANWYFPKEEWWEEFAIYVVYTTKTTSIELHTCRTPRAWNAEPPWIWISWKALLRLLRHTPLLLFRFIMFRSSVTWHKREDVPTEISKKL